MKRMHEEPQKHSCPKCENVFKSKKYLDRHLMNVHTDLRQECDICKKMIKTYHLKNHKRYMHDNPQKYPCNLCQNVFTAKGSLNQHVKNVHDDERQECEICNITIKKYVIKNVQYSGNAFIFK